VYILLPVYNRRLITEHFVECLKAQTFKNYHLVLIDDGSTDGTAEMVQQHIDHLTIIRGQSQWWWAGSLQKGYEWISANKVNPDDIVVIMNDDTEFKPDFLEIGVSILHAHPKTLLGAQCYGKSSEMLLDQGVKADWRTMRFDQAKEVKEINCLSTMGLFMRAKDFIDLGGFYPRFLPHFASDYEFTMRAHRRGFLLITDPSLRLWLREDTTWNVEIGSEPFFTFVRNLFSKKSAYNPLVWTMFIGMTCPMKWKILNWYRIWMGTTFVVVSRMFKPVKLPGNTHFAGKESTRS
jgi:GT2 family glycosyltransferase